MNKLIIIIIVLSIPDGSAADIPVNTLIPEIKGTDFPTSGSTLTLKADVGRWNNSPQSFTYNWHTVGGPSIGRTSTLTLDPSTTTGAVILDVTAKNAAGTATQSSHWFGPISTAPPTPPVENETLNKPVEEWSTEPARFLQNGHAIFPGCDIPPIDPTATDDHIWYFDPIKGQTQSDMTAAGVPPASQGHKNYPFKDITAFWNRVTGYNNILWKSVIQPGDTVLLEPGWGGSNPVGDIIGPITNVGYSTSDGTTSGSIKWTWIMGDPAASSRPVLHRIAVGNGNGSIAGFIFKDLSVEQYRETNAISLGFNNNVQGQPTHDVHFENISVSGWLGHSNDPWLPSHYPTTGGTSDGTVLTASPLISASAPQDPATPNVTAEKGSTHITLSAAVPVGSYVWSPGYYRSGNLVPGVGGIPNGTKIVALNGLDATIAPCDPVADAATGCPTQPIPGCDPIISIGPVGERSGGCKSIPQPVWSGTTRALNNEKISVTDQMRILPAGYFNSTDWQMALASGFRFAGQLDRANSPDPANPNILRGVKCTSIKDSMVRWNYNGIQLANVTNSILYNNRVKLTSGDSFDGYTTHRVWYIHNQASDPTLIWAHQDAIQFGDTNGNVAIKYYYNNAVIENEFLQWTDETNAFPRPWQGVNTTENYHWGMYVCCNLITANSNALRIAGKWDVVAHNTVIGNATVVEHQRKTQGGVPSDVSATHHLLANNIGNGVSRDSAIPDYCNPKTGDLNTVVGNISIPFLPPAPASSVFCDLAGAGKWSAAMGVYQGLTTWSVTDFSPLFVAYSPIPWPVDPPDPGWGQGYTTPFLTPCVHNSFPWTGSCAGTEPGVINLRPNPVFDGFSSPIALTTTYAQWLPPGYPDGSFAVVTSPGGTGANYASPGVWRACASCSTNANGAKVPWEFVQADFNPGIISAGTNLGPQQPIADHDGKAWANPPASGAYELKP